MPYLFFNLYFLLYLIASINCSTLLSLPAVIIHNNSAPTLSNFKILIYSALYSKNNSGVNRLYKADKNCFPSPFYFTLFLSVK